MKNIKGEEYYLISYDVDEEKITISKYGDNWYCYGGAFYETYSIAHNTAYINAYLLPEEGQHYMENLVGSKSY